MKNTDVSGSVTNTFLQSLGEFIQKESLFEREDKVLVAVSGGIDSIALLHALVALGYVVSAAHCNFKLRDEASDLDEQLVSSTCKALGIACHVKAFETAAFARDHGMSIQMAARKLRYEWFEDLLSAYKYTCIATAHHIDDSIETFFINLIQVTGLRGLTGIPLKYKRVVRPFLYFRKTDIVRFAEHAEISYREDSSNATNAYERNKIRHSVIPRIEAVFPGSTEQIHRTIQLLSLEEEALNESLQEIWGSHWLETKTGFEVPLPSGEFPAGFRVFVGRNLLTLGFSSQQVHDLVARAVRQSGKRFLCSDYILTIDRESWIVTRREHKNWQQTVIDSLPCAIETPFGILKLSPAAPGDSGFQASPNMEFLDVGRKDLPFLLRKWQPGDHFRPLGMRGSQKLQDFLTNIKMPVPEKDRLLVLTVNDKIMWVVGHRLDDRFRITPGSGPCVFAEWYPL